MTSVANVNQRRPFKARSPSVFSVFAHAPSALLVLVFAVHINAAPTLRISPGNNSVRALSTDGRAAVGWTDTASGPRSFHWTASAFQALPPAPGDIDSRAYGISGDGMVVVGDSGPDAARGAIRWTIGAGAVELLPLPGHVKSTAYAISSDGTTVVGDSELVPVRWESGPRAVDLNIGGGIAMAASANGSVLAGAWGNSGFRWSESTGVETLAGLPGGGPVTQARSLSADGSIAAGFSQTSGPLQRYRAVRWTSAGIQDLGLFDGGIETFGLGINAGGNAVVGYGRRSAGGYRAILWTEAFGMVDLNSYLPTQGISLNGMILDYAFAISADGTAIGGMGHMQTGGANFGWVVTGLDPVPEPATAFLLLGAVGFLRRRRPLLAR